MADVTSLLEATAAGDPVAVTDLFQLVYYELGKQALCRLAEEPAGQMLKATDLVLEAYLRLVGAGIPTDWNHRGHFFAAAAEAIRRILINQARDNRRLKRGSARERVNLDALPDPFTGPGSALIALDGALSRLAGVHSQAADLVKLRNFTGRTLRESAKTLGLPPRTADRVWVFARAWLADGLDPIQPAAGNFSGESWRTSTWDRARSKGQGFVGLRQCDEFLRAKAGTAKHGIRRS